MKTLKTLFLILPVVLTGQTRPGVDAPVAIPFDTVKNQIIVSVFIKDQGPYNMLFDTGVVPSAIDINLAERLHLPLDTTASGLATGRGNAKIKLYPSRITHIKTGDLKVEGIDAVALNLNYLGKPLGKPLHGILGYSLLKDRIFKIDYADKKIECFASREALNKSLHNKRYIITKFVFQEGDIIPIIDNLTINGIPFTASLDTGSSLNVELFEHHISTYRIAVDTTAGFTVTGAQGKAENFHITIDRLSLGDKSFQNLKGGVAKVKNTGQLRKGNIGNGFLKQFKVSFDYIHKEVIFEY